MEVVYYTAALAALLAMGPLRRAVLALTPLQRIAVAVLLVGAIAGQLTRNSGRTYPFLYWDMYSHERHRVGWSRYEGVRPDGVVERLPVEEFVRLPHKLYMFQLGKLAFRAWSAEDPSRRERAWASYQDTLLSGLAAYQSRHPERVWTRIRVLRCDAQVAGFAERGERCELIWEIDPSASRSG